MSRIGKQQLIVYESAGGWRGTNITNPIPLHLLDEKLDYGVNYYLNENLFRDTRNYSGSAIVHDTQKPEGQIIIEPRPNEINGILFSHFQKGTVTYFGTLGTRWNFEPDRGRVSFSGGTNYGTVSGTSGDVFSVDLVRSYDTGTKQSIIFQRGVCNKLNFLLSSTSNMRIAADFKFKTATTLGTGINPVWGSDANGGCVVRSYDYIHPFQGFEGTFNIDGISVPIETLNISSENNLLERIILGANYRDSFVFGDYSCNGNFTLDMPSDGLNYLQSALAKTNGTITGTVFHHGSSYIGFNLPYIVYKPTDPKLGDVRRMQINFEAFERNGTAPFQLTVRSPGTNISTLNHPNAYTGSQITGGTWTIGGCDANFQSIGEFSSYFGTSNPIGLTADTTIIITDDTVETIGTLVWQIKPTGTTSFRMFGNVQNTDITKGRTVKFFHDTSGLSITRTISTGGEFQLYNLNFARGSVASGALDLSFNSGVSAKGTLHNVFLIGSNKGDIGLRTSNVLSYNIGINSYTKGLDITASDSIYENFLINSCATAVLLNNSSFDNIYRNMLLLGNDLSWKIPAGVTNASEGYFNAMSDGHGSNAYWTPGSGNINGLTDTNEITTTFGESFGQPKATGTIYISGTRSVFSQYDMRGSAWSTGTKPSMGIYQYGY